MALGQFFKGRVPGMRDAIDRLEKSEIIRKFGEQHGKRTLTMYQLVATGGSE